MAANTSKSSGAPCETAGQLCAAASGEALPKVSRLSYEAWYDSPRGAFALAAQQVLLRRMIAGWPRRGHSLLELFCASGRFLESFWEAGFDVTGQEQDQHLAALARKRLGRRVDITLNNPARLPFDDKSFDYVVCLNGLEFVAGTDAFANRKNSAKLTNSTTVPQRAGEADIIASSANIENTSVVLREAGRLARRGILLGFPNAWSAQGALARLRHAPQPEPAFGSYKNLSPLRVCKSLRALDLAGRSSWASILLGPATGWGDDGLRKSMNMLRLPLPVGACVMLRLDFAPIVTGTPLLLEAMPKKAARKASFASSFRDFSS